IGGLNLGGFFGAQPDTPVKLAGFAYAFEHLEIAAYELLRRVAERAGDQETVAIATRILAQERTAAERVADTWDAAADAALDRVDGRTDAQGLLDRGVEVLVALGQRALEPGTDLGVAEQRVEGPGQRGRGRLVAGEQERDELVAQLVLVQRRAVLVAGLDE